MAGAFAHNQEGVARHSRKNFSARPLSVNVADKLFVPNVEFIPGTVR